MGNHLVHLFALLSSDAQLGAGSEQTALVAIIRKSAVGKCPLNTNRHSKWEKAMSLDEIGSTRK